MLYNIQARYKSLMYVGMYEKVMLGIALSPEMPYNCLFPCCGYQPRYPFCHGIFIEALLVISARFMYRFLRRIKHSRFDRESVKRLMIIGGGDSGSIIVKELQQNDNSNSKAVAIIDDNKSKKGMKLHGVSIVGNRHDIVRVAKEKRIDEIIIAIPSASREEISEIYGECVKTDCKVRILPSISHIIDGRISINMVRDVELEDLLGRDVIRTDLNGIAAYLKGKVILVTGGGGSIGSELCRQIAGFNPGHL